MERKVWQLKNERWKVERNFSGDTIHMPNNYFSFIGLTYVNLWIYSLEVDTLHEASSSALEQSGMPSHT